MAYTVTQLAHISKVSVRTLHWYDEIGLLKPAYHGTNGYRYYEEEQLLLLQQILFFRELGLELKEIQKILQKGDFDQLVALSAHRQVLSKRLEKTRKLIKTIDQTIQHLKGIKKMNENAFFSGFSPEVQEEYERQIVERFGAEGKAHIEEAKAKKFSKADEEAIKKQFVQICQELTALGEKKAKMDSVEVQKVIRRHYAFLKRFWTPTKISYAQHGKFIMESDLRKAYEVYHPRLPEWICEAIQIFAEKEL